MKLAFVQLTVITPVSDSHSRLLRKMHLTERKSQIYYSYEYNLLLEDVTLGTEWINAGLKERDKCQDEHRVESLHLVRFDVPIALEMKYQSIFVFFL